MLSSTRRTSMCSGLMNIRSNSHLRCLISSRKISIIPKSEPLQRIQHVESSTSHLWVVFAAACVFVLALDSKHASISKTDSVLAQMLGKQVSVVTPGDEATIQIERQRLKVWLEYRFPEDQYRITLDDSRPGHRDASGGKQSAIAPIVLYRVERRAGLGIRQDIRALALYVHHGSLSRVDCDRWSLKIHAIKQAQGHTFEYPVTTALYWGSVIRSAEMIETYSRFSFVHGLGHLIKSADAQARISASATEEDNVSFHGDLNSMLWFVDTGAQYSSRVVPIRRGA